MAQGYVIQDNGFYPAAQSAFNTQATTFKTALGYTEYDVRPAKTTKEGEAYLGNGAWRGQDIPLGVTVKWSVNGQGSLTQVMAFVAIACSGVKGTSTTLATTGFTHPYTMNTHNSTKKYMTLAFVENESSAGSGLKTIMVKDAIASNVQITAQSGQTYGFTASGEAISMGPGAASTFSLNNVLHIPDLTNAASVITYPSFFPVGFCSTQFNMNYTADLSYGPNCIGSPTASDINFSNPRWTVDGAGIADTNFSQFFDTVWYDSTSPGSTANEIKAKLQSGALDIVLTSDDIIPSSSPATPFSVEFNFPTMQFVDAYFTGNGTSTRMGNWQAKSYGSGTTININNDLSSASMTI